MTTHTNSYSFEKYPPSQQGVGSFDGGKITEIKPIPFPHESGGVQRVGPLLYWAWATAHGDGTIGMHPHQGFEIVSYVFNGSVGHTDSAGNNRRVHAGGAQIMQTGSGISHQEEMYGERTDFFQIWFEPDLAKSIHKSPTYRDFEDRDFPIVNLDTNATLKRIVGPKAPAQLDAPVEWNEIVLAANGHYTVELAPDSLAALMVISGSIDARIDDHHERLDRQDFALVKSQAAHALSLTSNGVASQVSVITAPLDPGYPLYRF